MSTDTRPPRSGLAGFVSQYIPEQPLPRRLVAVRLAAATGKGVLLSGSVVYFTLHVGLTAAEVGIGLSAAGFAALASSVVFGIVADRVRKRALLFGQFVAVALGFGLYALVHDAVEFYILVMLISFFDTGMSPTEGAMIAALIPADERVRLNATMRSVFNIGFSVGIGIAAVAAINSRLLLLIPLGSAVLLGAAALLVTRLPEDAPKPRPAVRPKRFGALRDRPYVAVVGLCAVLASHMTLLTVVLPLWTLDRTHVPHFVVPLFLVFNTVFVILFQVRASKGAETVSGAARIARRSGVWVAAACGAAAITVYAHNVAAGIAAIIVAVLALSMAEILQSSSAWGMAFALAPDNAQAEYLGTFDLHIGSQNIVGPVVLSGLVMSRGVWGWAAIAAAVLLAAALIVPAARRSEAAMAALTTPEHVAERAGTV